MLDLTNEQAELENLYKRLVDADGSTRFSDTELNLLFYCLTKRLDYLYSE